MLLMALPALGESAVAVEDKPYTWDGLATMAGATAAVLLIVQYTKTWLDKLTHIPTRAVVLVLSITIYVGANAALGGITWLDLPPLVLSGVMVAASAMGAYEVTFARKAQDKPSDDVTL